MEISIATKLQIAFAISVFERKRFTFETDTAGSLCDHIIGGLPCR